MRVSEPPAAVVFIIASISHAPHAQAGGDQFTDKDNFFKSTPSFGVVDSYSRGGGGPVVFTFKNPALPLATVPLTGASQADFEGPQNSHCDQIVEIFRLNPFVGTTPPLLVSAHPVRGWHGILMCVVGSDMIEPEGSLAVTALLGKLTQQDPQGNDLDPVLLELRPRPRKAVVPRQDGHTSPLGPAVSPTFDSDGDGVDDVILFADTPGRISFISDTTLVQQGRNAITVATGNKYEEAVSLYYEVSSKCRRTSPPTNQKVPVHGIVWGFTYKAVIGPDEVFTGAGSNPTVAEIIAATVISRTPPTDPTIIPNSRTNGTPFTGRQMLRVVPP